MTHFDRLQSPSDWTRENCFAELKNPWLTLLGERWRDGEQKVLDYWRVERADSLIVIPQAGDRLLLPPPMFRPGLGRATWDFPGGRLTPGTDPEEALIPILQRELNLPPSAVLRTEAINPQGWAVDSSFSNQCLYGYWATIDPIYPLEQMAIGWAVQMPQQLPELLAELTCLQCRALLQEKLN